MSWGGSTMRCHDTEILISHYTGMIYFLSWHARCSEEFRFRCARCDGLVLSDTFRMFQTAYSDESIKPRSSVLEPFESTNLSQKYSHGITTNLICRDRWVSLNPESTWCGPVSCRAWLGTNASWDAAEVRIDGKYPIFARRALTPIEMVDLHNVGCFAFWAVDGWYSWIDQKLFTAGYAYVRSVVADAPGQTVVIRMIRVLLPPALIDEVRVTIGPSLNGVTTLFTNVPNALSHRPSPFPLTARLGRICLDALVSCSYMVCCKLWGIFLIIELR